MHLMDELLRKSALELAGMIRAGELGPTELVGAALERITALDPTINSFTHIAGEEAIAEAETIRTTDQRPFAGVPIAIKDNRAVRGMPLTMGSDLFGEFRPRHDTFFVRRLRAAGFVIIGKTALPENGILPTTESRRNGPTRNPWALDRTPGGSSGGSAAAVAAGMIPIAHGNDGGGSTRIPAACCGLVGLKPARGRVSVGPESGQSFLVGDGVLTRTVADTAALLDVMAGYELGDANWAPPPQRPFAEMASPAPGRRRIALAFNPPLEGAVLDPVCETAARDAAALLVSLGHHIEEVTPPWSGLDLLSDFTRAFAPGIAMTSLVGAKATGRELSEADVEPLTWEMYEHARNQDTLSYLSALSRLENVGRALVAFLAEYDMLLTPALARRPVPIGEIHGRGPDPWGNYRRSGHFTPYTAVVNVMGLPAIALPLYQGDDGLPTAVQLVGKPAGEGMLLMVASQLEQALPWSERRAPI
jgi:amidase